MKNKLPKYDKYKPSGVEWLGEIPEHWEVKRLKDICFINQKVLPENMDSNFSFKYVDIGSVTFEKGVTEAETFKFKNAPSRARRIAKTGDTIISTVRTYLKAIDYIDDKKSEYIYSTGFAILTPYNCSPRFLAMSVKSDSFTNQVDIFSTGMSYPAINSTELSRLRLPIPPLIEQTRIAEFLDRKTVQIDQAIGIKEKQIALLKERRQLMIHRAVTRGVSGLHWDSSDLGISGLASEGNIPKSANQVNPDSDIYHRNQPKLKPSGVEWIGDIPEHWEVKKIKHITSKIGSGVTPSGGGTTYLDSGIPLLRSQNILFGKIELEGVAYISDKIHASMSNSQVKKGDVLLNVTGGSIGRCHFVELDIPMNVNQHVCIIRPTEKIISIFLNSLLTSNVGQSQIWFFQQGGGREGLNFQAIKNFLLPLPPIEEQKQIVTHIETLSSKIATAISLKEQEIAKLKEYKSVLINGAVTGKVKVG